MSTATNIKPTPKIVKISVIVKLECDDGYESTEEFNSKHMRAGVLGTVIEGFREMARLAHLYGFGAEAQAAYDDVKARLSR